MQYAPARVHIVQDDTRPKSEARSLRGSTSNSYIASTTPQLILPRSAGRRKAIISVADIAGNPNVQGLVLIADSQSDAAAVTAYLTGQNIPGAVLAPGMNIEVTHNNEVWLSRFPTGGAITLVVSVIAEFDGAAGGG